MGVIDSSTPPRQVRVAGAPVSTGGLIAALSIITLLVFALPPGLAVWVNQRRESRAEAPVQRLASELSTEAGRSALHRAAADGVISHRPRRSDGRCHGCHVALDADAPLTSYSR